MNKNYWIFPTWPLHASLHFSYLLSDWCELLTSQTHIDCHFALIWVESHAFTWPQSTQVPETCVGLHFRQALLCRWKQSKWETDRTQLFLWINFSKPILFTVVVMNQTTKLAYKVLRHLSYCMCCILKMAKEEWKWFILNRFSRSFQKVLESWNMGVVCR